ncbi:hypothetical protein PEDI_22770 [Persicobacter diffluens]|uniref:Uncharacterized protein n=1 Tax=Persicobacter diffluens TaxID=981 RepID=A0AAN4VZK8_9BACT|nr:hypothetical protein PEDI_22770 [Persicobacter diffluens]
MSCVIDFQWIIFSLFVFFVINHRNNIIYMINKNIVSYHF